MLKHFIRNIRIQWNAFIVPLLCLVCVLLAAATLLPVTLLPLFGVALLLGWAIVYFGLPKLPQYAGGFQAEQYTAQPMADKSLPSAAQKFSEATVEDLFDSLPIALLRLDGDNQIVASNSAARDLLLFKQNERVDIADLVENLGRSLFDWLQQARDAGVKPEMLRIRRAKGDATVQINLHPITQDNSLELIAVITDATELKSLEAQIVQSQKMQAIGQLAGGVAHDFNNLLTAITGYCDLLLMRHQKTDPSHNDLTQIAQNANRAAALVGQLLAFSRKQTLTPKAVDVNEVLAEHTHLLTRLVTEKVTLTLTTAKQLPKVNVDSRQLEQVIMNLVVNARDAMPDGGRVSIRTEMRDVDTPYFRDRAEIPEGKYVIISVEDDGDGIPEGIRDRIFEPFTTTKDVGKGTGLGLSTAFGIIKQTGGFIFFETEIGHGTCFQIFLPALKDGEGAQTVGTRKSKESSRRDLQGLSVLLVEDEAPVRAVAARALHLQGIDVLEVGSAEEALELLETRGECPDVVITDVIMPGMDGPTWIQIAQKTFPDMHVVFISGYARESLSESQHKISNASFLPKPFALKDLIEAVEKSAKSIS